MHKYLLAAAILATMLLTGCVLSFHPLFSEGDASLDPAFEGVWKTQPGEPRSQDLLDEEISEVTFTVSHYPQTWQTYFLEISPKGRVGGKFIAQIGALGTNRFLQIAPSRPDNIHPKTFFGAHFMQTWSFFRMQVETNKLSLAEMNYLWLEEMLKQNKVD